MPKVLIFIFIFLLFPSKTLAQVVINEFSSKGDTEWIELFNSSASSVDLTGWTLSDAKKPPEALTGSIEAAGYFVFEKGKGWLNDGGDSAPK